RISEASLPVMVRLNGTTAVSVKGRASAVAATSTPPTMRISNVSEKGLAHLSAQLEVQVEFIMMATKVMFMARILVREQNSLTISLPTSLISIERRKNARFTSTDELTAYLDFSKWRPSGDDQTTQPHYPHQIGLASYLAVADLSFGGLCAVSRFPSSSMLLKRGIIDDGAKLILPLQEPLPVAVEIRWIKRIKESVKVGDDNEIRQVRSYRFGIEFVAPSDQVRLRIRQFIQQLSQAGAI
ncbi:MAG: hypothetical protein NTZ90_06895, partial [Proteobacteria bacterium]|nr:hypothetical protein [Pseudomonadota bacterium]